jgi:hypothetical protein
MIVKSLLFYYDDILFNFSLVVGNLVVVDKLLIRLISWPTNFPKNTSTAKPAFHYFNARCLKFGATMLVPPLHKSDQSIGSLYGILSLPKFQKSILENDIQCKNNRPKWFFDK